MASKLSTKKPKYLKKPSIPRLTSIEISRSALRFFLSLVRCSFLPIKKSTKVDMAKSEVNRQSQ